MLGILDPASSGGTAAYSEFTPEGRPLRCRGRRSRGRTHTSSGSGCGRRQQRTDGGRLLHGGHGPGERGGGRWQRIRQVDGRAAECAANARAVAEANGRHVGRPVAHPADKIEYAPQLKAGGAGPGAIATKTGIPKTSLHRYLTPAPTSEAQT